MATALVVDDAAVDQRIAGRLLEKDAGLEVLYASDGVEALAAIKEREPDLVVTDMLMPNMDGLELVDRIRADHPGVPVILMTAYGSEEIAAEALQRGAASYVPKSSLAEHLPRAVVHVLAAAGPRRRSQMTTGRTAFTAPRPGGLTRCMSSPLR